MITILNPALLLTASPQGPLLPTEEKVLSDVVDNVARVCRANPAGIPAVDWYWRKLQMELVRPLRQRTTEPRLRQGLDALQQHARQVTLAGTPTAGTTRLWGVAGLFRWSRLPAEWFEIMERLLIGCAQLGEPIILVTRLFQGRNMAFHAIQRSVLTEKTRWRLYLHVPGQAPRHVPCVRNPRNLAVPWTTRFDEKLPEGGHFPFCPPEFWWRRNVKAHGTVVSKPAWVDGYGGGWSQPTTGGDHHWDVFLQDPKLEEAVGINPINVVAWGNTEGKIPGDIHHVKTEQKGRFRGVGWTCPRDP